MEQQQEHPRMVLPEPEVLAAALDQLAQEYGALRASLAVALAERDQARSQLAQRSGDAGD